MRTFGQKLDEALKGTYFGKPKPATGGLFTGGFMKRPGGTSIDTWKAYTAPSFYRVLSDKLSRLVKHHIIVLVGGGLEKYAGGPEDDVEINELSELTKIPPETFKDSITLMVVGDNDQPSVTPWLILHQLAEGMGNLGFDVYDMIYDKYKAYLERAPKIDTSISRSAEVYGPNAGYPARSFHHLFKMRSARLFKHGTFDNIDPGQEIMVEFLWHGGKVRMNYPNWIDRRVVDSIKTDIEEWLDDLLTKMKGTRVPNTVLDPEDSQQFRF